MSPELQNDDLGIETFEDVYQAKFQQIPKKEETSFTDIAKEGGRHVLRTGARVAETLVGLPGDIRDVSKFAGSWLGDKARSLIGKDPLTDEQRSYIEEEMKPGDFDLLGRLTESLPTSSSLRENVTRKYTEDYLEPQNEWERFADDVAGDFAALAIPVRGKIPFARSLGTSIFANAGGEVAGAFGGEKVKDYTKLGLLFTSGMIGHKMGGVKKYINGLYNDMRAEVPEGAKVSSKQLAKELKKVKSTLRKGDPSAPSKQEAFKKIEAIQKKMKGGEIAIDEVLELTRNTNESIYGLGDLKRSENQLYSIRKALQDTSKEYGSQNAGFLEKLNEANQAFAATETSRNVGNFVRKNIKPRDYVHAAGVLGLEGAVLGAPTALTTIGAGAAVAATAYSAEIMKRIAKSPALRKYYQNVVTNSLKQNKAGLLRAVNQLDKGIEESLRKEPYETVEFDED